MSAVAAAIFGAWVWASGQPAPWVVLAAIVGFVAVLWLWNGITWRRLNRPPNQSKGSDESPTSFPFDTEHFLKSIFIYTAEVDRKKVDGPTPHFIFTFYIFNGSGFPIELTDEISGRAQVRGTFLESPEMVGHQTKAITYPGSGSFKVRQFLEPNVLGREIEFAKSPQARAADKMFGDDLDAGPNISFSFDEVKVTMIAKKGSLSHEFQKPLRSVEAII